MIYAAIDIGYKNLGLVQADHNMNVSFMKKIDISRLPHKRMEWCDCKIPHTNEVADLVAHFVQEYQDVLLACDVLLMERQPPGGLTNVETLLLFMFRDKVKLVSPNAMHAHFGMNHLDYEQRKERTVEIASKYVTLPDITRKHDIADALCMILYDTQLRAMDFKKSSGQEKLPFENYRFNHAESLHG